MDAILCSSCGSGNRVDSRFCRQCGGALKGAEWTPEPAPDEPGHVDDGVWHRSPSEFARKVGLDEMGSSLGRKTLRVPAGSLAVAVVDGTLEVFRPGSRITAGWLDRIKGALGGKLDRTDFYLIDTRPIPVAFPIDVRSRKGVSTQIQIVVAARVDSSEERLMRFLDQVVGDRDSFSQRELYDRIRPTIMAQVTPHLSQWSRQAEESDQVPDVIIGQHVAETVGQALGMIVTASAVPTTSNSSLDLNLGAAPVPALKACVNADCGQELQASKKFCGKCGSEQPASTTSAPSCPQCHAVVRPGKKFCASCGGSLAGLAAPSPEMTPLFTRDGQQIEVDLVVRGQGPVHIFSMEKVEPVVAAVVTKVAKEIDFAALSTAEGFARLETGVAEGARASLLSLGLDALQINVLDVRSKTGEWLLGARAELEQARQEMTMGREWLAHEEQALDLQVLSLDLALRTQRAERDHRFAQDRDELEDRRRRQELADGTAELDIADADRDTRTALEKERIARDAARTVADRQHEDDKVAATREHELRMGDIARTREAMGAQTDAEMELERKVAEHDTTLARSAMRLESDKTRLRSDDQAHHIRTQADAAAHAARAMSSVEQDNKDRDHTRSIDKLKTMAEIDAEIRAHELRVQDGMKDMSADQILASQVGGPQAEHVARAIAESGSKEKAMYERMLEQQNLSQAQMMHMMEKMMASQQATTTAALGAQQASQASERTTSTEALHAMSNVASARVSAPPRSTRCCDQPEIEDDARFCSSCGKPTEA